ncbi:hypothetical protein L6452_19843 [Arctium lappa]|uniref:Uncharacterized protein n=1 Tax=Arctium lappa TaxID=4217 RepID=A0ACB9BAK3_ARCLA|nr:hypothetical protein L6452_19843 [Arctium lappa]
MARSEGKNPQQNPEEAIREKTIIEQKEHNTKDDGDKENSTLGKEADSDEKSTALEDLPEFIYIDKGMMDDYLRCQICLGMLKEVTAVKACSHRFCKNCIAASIRMGNKVCPLCRAPCSSHRATVEDANLDGFIKHLLPYMDQEDCKLSEEDKSRNEQLQASISATKSRQQNSKRKRNDRRDT